MFVARPTQEGCTVQPHSPWIHTWIDTILDTIVNEQDAACSKAYTSTSVVHDGRIGAVRFVGHVDRRVDYHKLFGRADAASQSIQHAIYCASREKKDVLAVTSFHSGRS